MIDKKKWIEYKEYLREDNEKILEETMKYNETRAILAAPIYKEPSFEGFMDWLIDNNL
jgi:hypothetical protein